MQYFRVIKGDVHDYFTGYTTVENELLTPAERNSKFRYLNNNLFEIVEVSRKQIYWFFGCRFERERN